MIHSFIFLMMTFRASASSAKKQHGFKGGTIRERVQAINVAVSTLTNNIGLTCETDQDF
jgi:hypothetical protein